jgi:hypothetical protein
MAWKDRITTTLFGNRLGLNTMSTSQTGGSVGADFVVGAEDVRVGVTTAETTASNLRAWGVSQVGAASSGVYTLDPPIPGVTKTLSFGSTANTSYIKTAGGETFLSSQGTTFSVFKSTSLVAGVAQLIGITTSVWGVSGGLSTATFALSTTT